MQPTTVDFYFDALCPWCWVTARWLREVVSPERDVVINWRPFSLERINQQELTTPKGDGHRFLRVCAAARDEQGIASVEKLYWQAGTRRHHESAEIGTPEALDALLAACDLPPTLAKAADEPAWDEVIDAEMEAIWEKAGPDVGVPIIAFDDAGGLALFGPVVSEVPPREESLAIWDAFVALAHASSFFELKRGRKTNVILGPPPTI